MWSRQLVSRCMVPRIITIAPRAATTMPSFSPLVVPQQHRTIMSHADLAPMDELSDARQNLRAVLEHYRQQNFGQTLFSRFVKEMVMATDTNHDGKISMQEMKNMLKRIGVDQLVSQEDLQTVFEEIGHQQDNGETLIYVDEIESILTQPSH